MGCDVRDTEEGPGRAEIPGSRKAWVTDVTLGHKGWVGCVHFLLVQGNTQRNSVLGRIETGFASPLESQQAQGSAPQITWGFQTICQSVFFGSAGNSLRKTEASSSKG